MPSPMERNLFSTKRLVELCWLCLCLSKLLLEESPLWQMEHTQGLVTPAWERLWLLKERVDGNVCKHVLHSWVSWRPESRAGFDSTVVFCFTEFSLSRFSFPGHTWRSRVRFVPNRPSQRIQVNGSAVLCRSCLCIQRSSLDENLKSQKGQTKDSGSTASCKRFLWHLRELLEWKNSKQVLHS